MADRPLRHWVNTVSREHVEIGRGGGFTQADHGAATRLRRLRPGDGLVFYSPRTQLRAGEPLQRFTAIGRVVGEALYQVDVSESWRPWRLAVEFLPCSEADARPLVGRLSFVSDPQRWGLPFRRGLFEVPAGDFALIAAAMGAPWPPLARGPSR